MIKDLIDKIIAFLKRQKTTITTTVVTALLLDIITGIIFGFAGAAVFSIVI